jgi:hypothetical protein
MWSVPRSGTKLSRQRGALQFIGDPVNRPRVGLPSMFGSAGAALRAAAALEKCGH